MAMEATISTKRIPSGPINGESCYYNSPLVGSGSNGGFEADLELSEVIIEVANSSPSKELRGLKKRTWKRKQSPRGLGLLGPARGFFLHSPPKSKDKSICANGGKQQLSKRKLSMSKPGGDTNHKKTKQNPEKLSEAVGMSQNSPASPAVQGRRDQ